MIKLIKGTVYSYSFTEVVLLDKSGVGWQINLVSSIALKLEDEITLHIHTNFNNGEITLWGFDSEENIQLFKKLISVSGVGPKTAQLIMISKSYGEIVNAINNSDIRTLKVKGLGEKTIQKVILDLKGVFKSKNEYSRNLANIYNSGPASDAIEALISLGFNRADIDKKIGSIDEESLSKYTSSELIKKILQL